MIICQSAKKQPYTCTNKLPSQPLKLKNTQNSPPSPASASSIFIKTDIVSSLCSMGVSIDSIAFCIPINCSSRCACDTCRWLSISKEREPSPTTDDRETLDALSEISSIFIVPITPGMSIVMSSFVPWPLELECLQSNKEHIFILLLFMV